MLTRAQRYRCRQVRRTTHQHGRNCSGLTASSVHGSRLRRQRDKATCTRPRLHSGCSIVEDPNRTVGVGPRDVKTPKRRNEVERLFRRLKGCRCIFSRFEKIDVMFPGFISVAPIADGLRLCQQANRPSRQHRDVTDRSASMRNCWASRTGVRLDAVRTLAGEIARDFNNVLDPIPRFGDRTLRSVNEGSRLHHDTNSVVVAAARGRWWVASCRSTEVRANECPCTWRAAARIR